MSFVITGATGQLGRLVVEQLLDRGVPPGEVVAAGRSVEKIKALAERGVTVRAVDFADPATLGAVLSAGDRVLLVSGMEDRVAQHGNVIDAARAPGVALLAYTSIVNADTATIALAADHQATEQLLRGSGVPFVLLRNSWYYENYTAQLPGYLAQGAVFGSAGDGGGRRGARGGARGAGGRGAVHAGPAGGRGQRAVRPGGQVRQPARG